jgi:hypothetical protein
VLKIRLGWTVLAEKRMIDSKSVQMKKTDNQARGHRFSSEGAYGCEKMIDATKRRWDSQIMICRGWEGAPEEQRKRLGTCGNRPLH